MWLFKKRDCDTQGHRMRKEKRTGIARSGLSPLQRELGASGQGSDGEYHFNCVGDDVEQEREICRDCDATWGWRTTYSNCLQSISMSSDRHRRLEKVGFVRD